MIKRFSILLLLVLATSSVAAQNLSVSHLKNHRWVATSIEYLNRDGGEYSWSFDETKRLEYFRTQKDGEDFSKESPYYMSDVKPAVFDSTKVGKNTSGKYLVFNSKVSNGDGRWYYKVEISEILDYAETQFTVRFPSRIICTFRKEALR